MIMSFSGDYRFLSNFYPSELMIPTDTNCFIFPTVEHAYQAFKTLDPKERIIISRIQTAGAAKTYGKKVQLRSDWEDIKLYVMYELVKQKFTFHDDLKRQLIATWNMQLIEGNNWNDTFWGVCNGVGHNHLGKILMRVRDVIQQRI